MTEESKSNNLSEILERMKKLNLEKLADSFDQFEDIAEKFLPGLMPTEALAEKAAALIEQFGEPAQKAIAELLCGPDQTLRDLVKGELDKDARKAALALVPPLIKQFTLDPAAALKVAGFIVGALVAKADDELCKSLAEKGLTAAATKPEVKPTPPPVKPPKTTSKPKKESTSKPSGSAKETKPPKTSSTSKPKTEKQPKTTGAAEKPGKKPSETKPQKTTSSSPKTSQAKKENNPTSTAKEGKPKKTTKPKVENQPATGTPAKPKTTKKPKTTQSPKK